MLLNISNHSSKTWQADQMQKAMLQYGIVADMPFPDVDPSADESAVSKLAQEYALKAEHFFNQQSLSPGQRYVHVMGEMTFTFCLVEMLQQKGIQCVASTTRRMSEEKGGRKVSRFVFIRFRKYEHCASER